MTDSTFLDRFAGFVGKMKLHKLAHALAKSKIAGETLSEERESAHPKFITEMLTGILRAVGQVAQVDRFIKRFGDEVLCDGAKIPWNLFVGLHGSQWRRCNYCKAC